MRYGQLFADQSKRNKTRTESKKNDSENDIENETNQSQTNGTSENKNHVNENQQNKITTSVLSDISFSKSSEPLKDKENEKMESENVYHWWATREITDIIRRRNNSPKTIRLVEQRNALSRPGTLRRRYDHQTQRTIFAPYRPNKRSSAEIAEIDAELIRKANKSGGGYQPV